jgi:quinone-modifying oxidoreductase subunit QmoC
MTGLMRTPFPLLSPIKLVANLGAALVLAGVILFLIRRWHEPSVYFDWFFLATLAGVVFTGIASELLRLTQNGIMYGVYFVHLVLVFALLLYAPYSKFAHFAYRTAALASSKSNGGS